MRMSVTGALQSKSVKKYVLQQSNCNVDTSQDNEEDKKPLEKNIFPPKIKEDMAFETENQFSPLKADKGTKSEAKKLRNIRLDLSSLKRGAIKETNVRLNDSSEESSEDELKKKKKITRPVVPNYVTNTERGPCRKPRQSRPDQLSFSSQNSPKISSQILSIERRNERERNRVKLVNEGFASLQDRIPDFISEAYNEEKRKKNAKKLSKVDTLRMAVDYIRHLETLLNLKSTEKTEDQWDRATPGEYRSPKYQPSSVDSPGTSFEQAYDQDRIFYAYDLNFESQKETLASGEEPVTLVILKSPNSYVEEDFQYYETFNSIKKENNKDVKEKISEKEEEDVKNLDMTERDPELLPKDVIKMAAKESMVLPLNNEPFAMSEGITIYF